MGLRSMKKVIKSFWVTAGENNVIGNRARRDTIGVSLSIKQILLLISDDLPNYI